jgi:hypothetical protein
MWCEFIIAESDSMIAASFPIGFLKFWHLTNSAPAATGIWTVENDVVCMVAIAGCDVGLVPLDEALVEAPPPEVELPAVCDPDPLALGPLLAGAAVDAVRPLPVPVALLAPALPLLEPPLEDGAEELGLDEPPLLSDPGAGDPNPPPSPGGPHATATANITASNVPIAVLSSLFMEHLDLVGFGRFASHEHSTQFK